MRVTRRAPLSTKIELGAHPPTSDKACEAPNTWTPSTYAQVRCAFRAMRCATPWRSMLSPLASLRDAETHSTPAHWGTSVTTSIRRSALAAVALALLGVAGCELRPGTGELDAASTASAHWTASTTAAPLSPLPASVPNLDLRRVALGRELFSDTRLSDDGLVSCSTCHALGLGGANAQAKSTLPNRPPVGVNVPTIFNLAYDF